MPSIRQARIIEVSPQASAILTAMLDDAQCPCGASARRLVIERTPLDRWGPSVRRKPGRPIVESVVVRTWCGSTHGHSWGEDGMTRAESDTVAMYEEDL